MKLNKKALRLSERYDREFGLLLVIFVGYYSLLANINSKGYLISLISMNFTVASLVLAILSISNSLKNRSIVYLKYSSKLLITSSIALFYLSTAVFYSSQTFFNLTFTNVVKIGSSTLFAFGIYFLLLGSFHMRPEVDMSLKEAYLEREKDN